MKILTPLTNTLDLGLSAAAAVVIHAVVLGVHFGAPAQAPVPQVQHVDRCESIAMLPKKSHARQLVRKIDREKVVKERALAEPIGREIHRNVETVEKVRAPERKCLETEERVMVEDGTERALDTARTAGREEIDLSRAATPAVEKDFRFIYPGMARRRGYEGSTLLSVTVSPRGSVIELRLVESSGHGILDRSAMKQMQELPFLPALDAGGHPVESAVVQAVDFVIDESD